MVSGQSSVCLSSYINVHYAAVWEKARERGFHFQKFNKDPRSSKRSRELRIDESTRPSNKQPRKDLGAPTTMMMFFLLQQYGLLSLLLLLLFIRPSQIQSFFLVPPTKTTTKIQRDRLTHDNGGRGCGGGGGGRKLFFSRTTTDGRRRASSAFFMMLQTAPAAVAEDEEDEDEESASAAACTGAAAAATECYSPTRRTARAEVSRSEFLLQVTACTTASAGLFFYPNNNIAIVANAFEGGIGGLGKTKPETGVVFLDSESSPAIQTSDGSVSAELLVNDGKQPVRVSFTAPWPLLPTTSGLEARDLRNPESAFVQVVSGSVLPPSTASASSQAKAMRQLLLDSVLSQRGKFGAYGTPTDVKVKALVSDDYRPHNLYSVTFTAYTPGQRESERQVFVRAVPVGGANNTKTTALLLLVAGTTRQRFKSQQADMEKVCDSFDVIVTPATNISRKKSNVDLNEFE